jgi:hypothetical protein
MVGVRRAIGVLALVAVVLAARTALGGAKPGTEFPGGEVHLGYAEVDGAKYKVEMQFFKVAQSGSCWDSVGRDAKGRVYVAQSTQRENTFLFRLDPAVGRVRAVGDLKSNVRYGGPDGSDNGKIHSSFVEWTDGCLYFPSHVGEDELRYGGHFWKLDPRTNTLTDLGVPDPGNTNFCISDIDPVRQVAYMVSTSAGLLIRYDFKTQTFTALARTGKDWVRYLPMDRAGNLYILGDNRIHRFDPVTERLETIVEHKETDPQRQFTGVIGAFTWGKDRKRLYFVSYRIGAAFAWTVGAPTVEYLGKFHPAGRDLDLRTIYVDAAEKHLYSVGSGGRADMAFYMLDLAKGKGYALLPLNAVLLKEFEGRLRAGRFFVHFSDYGGVTGDDGTMYSGFHGSGRDQDLAPGGLSIVALVAMRVQELTGAAVAEWRAPTPVEASTPPPPPTTRRSTTRRARGGGAPPVVDEESGSRAGRSGLGAQRPDLPPPPGAVAQVGIVDRYRPIAADPQGGKLPYLPLAYWVYIKPAEGAQEQVLLVDVDKTAYVEPFDRHLLRGWRVRYTGVPVAAKGDRPAHIDTTVAGGRLEFLLDSVPAARLADCTVGKRVAVEGLIEPRQGWMDYFEGEENPNWKLLLTLPSGETIDLADPWLWQIKNFETLLKLIRAREAVKVRVVGEVQDAAPFKSEKKPGTPKDVRGAVVIAVDEVTLLSHAPGTVRP